MAAFADMWSELSAGEAPVFAVLDGAQFVNLPQELLLGGFQARPLYLDRGDNNPDRVTTAPHLVALGELDLAADARPAGAVAEALHQWVGDRAAMVLWRCSAGGEAMFRHLRGINMVMYPPDPAAKVAPAEENAEAAGAEMVLFRHADANVLSQVIPAMTQAELSRFYGPADALMLHPTGGWGADDGWQMVQRPAVLPAAAPGPLTISDDTVQRIDGQRLARRHSNILTYLRRHAAPQTQDLDDAALGAQTGQYIAEAQGYGVTSEAGLGRWCLMQTVSGGGLSNNPDVATFMMQREPSVTADQRVRILMRQTIDEIERQLS